MQISAHTVQFIYTPSPLINMHRWWLVEGFEQHCHQGWGGLRIRTTTHYWPTVGGGLGVGVATCRQITVVRFQRQHATRLHVRLLGIRFRHLCCTPAITPAFIYFLCFL